ncbi:MAG: iron-sulfur cluster assembly protein [Marinilabiliales bacterium]
MKEKIIEQLKTVYDQEISVNIYDLGLIYEIILNDDNSVKIVMTLTSPNCPMADDIIEDVREKVSNIEGVKKLDIELTFDPPWDKSRMSDEALLELGLL